MSAMQYWKPASVLIVVIVVTIAVSLAVGRLTITSTAAPTNDLGMPVPPPTSVMDLVSRVDLVVIGTIESEGRPAMEGPYTTPAQPGGGPSPSSDARSTPTPAPAVLPVAYFTLNIEAVIMGDGGIQPGGSIVLRVAGEGDATVGGPMPKQGDRFVFALAKNPDGQSYGPYFGPWSFYHLDGNVVTYADWDRSPVDFTSHVTPAAFVETLKRAAQAEEA